jgi:hypothetical protein
VVLYEYNITDTNLNKYPLLQNPSQNILKKDKPDFESLTHFQDTLYIFGSAHNKRNAMIEFDLKTNKKPWLIIWLIYMQSCKVLDT